MATQTNLLSSHLDSVPQQEEIATQVRDAWLTHFLRAIAAKDRKRCQGRRSLHLSVRSAEEQSNGNLCRGQPWVLVALMHVLRGDQSCGKIG